jgi:Ca-activated chloride channel family protein
MGIERSSVDSCARNHIIRPVPATRCFQNNADESERSNPVGSACIGVYRRLIILLGASVAALALAAIALAQDPTLTVNVRLVHLLATVTDASGGLVTNLHKEDFTIFDNGNPQKISLFERTSNQPVSVSILIDNSGSTAKDLKSEVDSVSRFVRTLFGSGNDLDRASLYSFNWEVVKRAPFTHNASQIDRELRGLHGEGGTSLYDAIYLASGELYDRDGRHVLVIVTDGADTTSTKDYQAAVRAAQRADIVIYPILIIPIENDAGRSTGGENALTTMSASTGGRVSLATLGPDLDQAFSRIIDELRTQYFIAYYPGAVSPPPPDPFHRISVQLSHPGLRISTRAGYYGESATVSSGTTRYRP